MGHTRVVCRLNLDKILPLLLRETKICSSHPIPPILFDTTTEQKFLVSKISLRCIILLIQNCCSISKQLHFRKVMHLSQSVLRLLNERRAFVVGFASCSLGNVSALLLGRSGTSPAPPAKHHSGIYKPKKSILFSIINLAAMNFSVLWYILLLFFSFFKLESEMFYRN